MGYIETGQLIEYIISCRIRSLRQRCHYRGGHGDVLEAQFNAPLNAAATPFALFCTI